MKNIQVIIALASCLFLGTTNAQELEDFKPNKDKYGLGKLKKGPKKIYIASFNVNFETYKEAVSYKASGGFRNNAKGEATASAAIGINGLEEADIQEKTNQLYNDFIADLKAKGFEIITAETAGKTKTYNDWQKASGPYVIQSGLPGVMTSVPEDYSFFYKKVSKNGKKKKGFLNGSLVPQKLSDELDDAVVANVNLYFMYSEAGNDFFKNAGGAKVKMFTNYRLISDYVVAALKKKGLRMKGAQTSDRINTIISFTKGKTGLGAETQYNGTLKKDLEIKGVIKKEKVVAYSKQTSETATSFKPVVIAGPVYSSLTKWIDVNSEKYVAGLYNAGSKFLNFHTSEFLSNY
tara:strand:- start:30908 stop:31954 length:1047 start_codon:yes stop_codon:yes gene_type:complete